MPGSILEAMAMARPVVATAVGGVPEALTTAGATIGPPRRVGEARGERPGAGADRVAVAPHPEPGRLVPPHDPRALAEAIADVLADPARAEAMGRAGRDRAERSYSVERMVRETEAMYEALAGRGRGA
jgi:starch synthase